MARRVVDEDPDALIVALAARHASILHIDFLEERLRVNEEMLTLVSHARAPEHMAHALHWRLYDLFEFGDMETAKREHATLRELAERLRQPLYRHFAAAWAAKWAETAGRFEEAEQLARASLEFGQRAHMPYAESNYAGQLFGLLRDQGRLDELPDQAGRYVGDRPKLPVWRAGLVGARLDAGQHDRARTDFEDLARDDFAHIPRDLFWLGAMCLLAEACGKLGDRPRAATLYDQLHGYADRNAQIGLALSVGIVHRFLGRLAATLERFEQAERHFDAALERSVRMHAVTSLAHIRCEYAEMLIARGAAGDRERAREHVGAARRTAERLGVQLVARRTATLEQQLQTS
jgi:tetratricopeptide (TPR) repeat protein